MAKGGCYYVNENSWGLIDHSAINGNYEAEKRDPARQLADCVRWQSRDRYGSMM
jgi:hypothetical protein